MGRIDVKINDKLDHKFRIEIVKRLGGRKGSFTQAIEEAISLWIKKN